MGKETFQTDLDKCFWWWSFFFKDIYDHTAVCATHSFFGYHVFTHKRNMTALLPYSAVVITDVAINMRCIFVSLLRNFHCHQLHLTRHLHIPLISDDQLLKFYVPVEFYMFVISNTYETHLDHSLHYTNL
jgi:hypothetical protein